MKRGGKIHILIPIIIPESFTTPGANGMIGIDNAVFQSGQRRNNLKGGTGRSPGLGKLIIIDLTGIFFRVKDNRRTVQLPKISGPFRMGYRCGHLGYIWKRRAGIGRTFGNGGRFFLRLCSIVRFCPFG